MKTAALITAAGSSQRMGGADKLFLLINGMPVLLHALSAYQKTSQIDVIYLSIQPEKQPQIRSLCASFGITKLKKIVPGGKTRQESVFNMLSALDGDISVVCVHDGARPMIKPPDISMLLSALSDTTDGIIPGQKLTETVKKVDAEGFIISTVPRDNLVSVQTPQIFRKETLLRAYEKAFKDNFCGTDESSLIERIGGKVKVIAPEHPNFKLTYKKDIPLLTKLMS